MNEANDNYLKVSDLISDLHTLFLRNLDESEEADAIRDEIDKYWLELTEVDKKCLQNYSAWLYDNIKEELTISCEPSRSTIEMDSVYFKK